MNMNIRARLKDFAMEHGGNIEVAEVRIGLGYTAVMLEDGSVGVAYTFLNRPTTSCSVFQGLRPFAGRKAERLLELFEATTELESALALATSNSITNRDLDDYLEGDVLAHLELFPDDVVGMVGNFAPICSALKEKVKEIKIFEVTEDPESQFLPSSLIGEILPQCQVALISSTSIINNTIDSILASALKCRQVVMLGASTPLVEDAFAHTPVSILSGIVITDTQGMLQVVSEGGGTRSFRKFTNKVNLKVSENQSVL